MPSYCEILLLLFLLWWWYYAVPWFSVNFQLPDKPRYVCLTAVWCCQVSKSWLDCIYSLLPSLGLCPCRWTEQDRERACVPRLLWGVAAQHLLWLGHQPAPDIPESSLREDRAVSRRLCLNTTLYLGGRTVSHTNASLAVSGGLSYSVWPLDRFV